MYRPLVSIITPTYCHEDVIGDCLASTIAQTYPDWEQIVIDDGSADRTAQVVSSFSDDRIHLVVQEHVGPYKLAETYNRALEMARGEIVAILEGDDYWPPRKLEMQVPSLSDRSVVLSHGLYVMIDAKGRTLGHSGAPIASVRQNTPRGSAAANFLLNGRFGHSSTILIRRDALQKVGGFRGDASLPFVDVPTVLDLSLIGEFAWVNEIVGYHRLGAASVTLSDWDWVNSELQYKLRFLARNQRLLRLGITEGKVVQAHRLACSARALLRGRIAAHRGQWSAAKDLFLGGLAGPSLKGRAASVVGYLGAKVRMDPLEWCSRVVRGYQVADLLQSPVATRSPDASL